MSEGQPDKVVDNHALPDEDGNDEVGAPPTRNKRIMGVFAYTIVNRRRSLL
jgi:hypothetical protein